MIVKAVSCGALYDLHFLLHSICERDLLVNGLHVGYDADVIANSYSDIVQNLRFPSVCVHSEMGRRASPRFTVSSSRLFSV